MRNSRGFKHWDAAYHFQSTGKMLCVEEKEIWIQTALALRGLGLRRYREGLYWDELTTRRNFYRPDMDQHTQFNERYYTLEEGDTEGERRGHHNPLLRDKGTVELWYAIQKWREDNKKDRARPRYVVRLSWTQLYKSAGNLRAWDPLKILYRMSNYWWVLHTIQNFARRPFFQRLFIILTTSVLFISSTRLTSRSYIIQIHTSYAEAPCHISRLMKFTCVWKYNADECYKTSHRLYNDSYNNDLYHNPQ